MYNWPGTSSRVAEEMRLVVGLEVLLASLSLTADQLSPNIVTEEVATRVVKTKYGKVQGFVSKVGRDAATSDFVQVFLGIPYASPPTGNYRSLGSTSVWMNVLYLSLSQIIWPLFWWISCGFTCQNKINL